MLVRRRAWLSVCVLAALAAGSHRVAAEPKQGRAAPHGQPAPAPAPQPMVYPLTPGYAVKPSDVVLPSDVPLGQYRRTFRPFPNWTLICDENLARSQKVCNIAQTILGPDGAPVLSWSLAANQGGEPLFIIRTPTSLGQGGRIQVDIPDGEPALTVPVAGCDAKVCLAYLPAINRLRAAVGKGMAVGISYSAGPSATVTTFKAPLAGLAAALASI